MTSTEHESGEEYPSRLLKWEVPETAKELVRLEATCRLSTGVRRLCEFVMESWLPAMYLEPIERRIALHTFDDASETVTAKDISTKAGARAFDAAVARVDSVPRGGDGLSLVSWSEGHPFHAPHGDEIWVTMFRDVDPGAAEYRVEMFVKREKAELVVGRLVELCRTFEVLSGCAWSPGGFWPSWSDRTWRLRVLPAPLVAGPFWLIVAPPAANRLLGGSERARLMAVDRCPLPDGGAVWQLSGECDGPLGAELDEWARLLTELGVWTPPPTL